MCIPKDIISKLGAEWISAQILSEMTVTYADADVTKCENSAVLSEEEKLSKTRELALYIRNVYRMLKEYSYLWWVYV